LHNLGETRSVRRASHLLHTPDTFIRTNLPGLQGASAIIHISPALGAAFTQYAVEFEANGSLESNQYQRFLYVLDGTLRLKLDGQSHTLSKDGYIYLPHGVDHRIVASTKARATVIEKPYQAISGISLASPIIASETDVIGQPLNGDKDLQVRSLLPDTPAFDFAVNTMTYQPGAALSLVEIHVMEHGLLMLEGGGIYRLDDAWYPVTAGDFIWMAPYCPQWFGAIGRTPAKYLIYKDWNRHPLG